MTQPSVTQIKYEIRATAYIDFSLHTASVQITVTQESI